MICPKCRTMSAEFSVWQFFTDGSHQCVRRNVEAEEAVAAFKHYTDNVATKLGMVTRVIITDGGDCTNAEWEAGEGLTYPRPEDLRRADAAGFDQEDAYDEGEGA